MKSYSGLGIVGAGLLALAACSGGSGGTSNSTPPLTGDFRVANGISDSDGLDAALSNVASFSDIGFGTASGMVTAPTGSYKAQMTSNSDTFTVNNVSIDQDNVDTVFVAGTISGGTQNGFAAEESLDAPASGQFNVQFVADASSRSGPINFYLITPGGSTTGKTANATVEYPFDTAPSSPGFSAVSSVAAGTYEIIVTNALGIQLFDSGTKGVALPTAGNVLQIAAIDTASGSSPISVLVLDNNGGNIDLVDGAN
jgi:hypothetical protein